MGKRCARAVRGRLIHGVVENRDRKEAIGERRVGRSEAGLESRTRNSIADATVRRQLTEGLRVCSTFRVDDLDHVVPSDARAVEFLLRQREDSPAVISETRRRDVKPSGGIHSFGLDGDRHVSLPVDRPDASMRPCPPVVIHPHDVTARDHREWIVELTRRDQNGRAEARWRSEPSGAPRAFPVRGRSRGPDRRWRRRGRGGEVPGSETVPHPRPRTNTGIQIHRFDRSIRGF